MSAGDIAAALERLTKVLEIQTDLLRKNVEINNKMAEHCIKRDTVAEERRAEFYPLDKARTISETRFCDTETKYVELQIARMTGNLSQRIADLEAAVSERTKKDGE